MRPRTNYPAKRPVPVALCLMALTADAVHYKMLACAGGNGSLAGRLEEFAGALPPILAEYGDLKAQREMFGRLKRILDEDEPPADHRLSWMSGVTERAMLPELFQILRRSYKLSDEPLSRVMSGFGLHDVVNPTTEGISRIGGRDAVAGYDEMIDIGGDYRWLGAQRDRVAAAVLSEDGERFAPEAARRMRLPLLRQEAH